MKSAAQLYTVREFTQNEKDFKQTLKKVKEMGYTSVQLSAAGPMAAKTVKEIIDEIDIPIHATHISNDMFVNKLDEVIYNHHVIGAKYAGLGAMPKECMQSIEKLDAFIERYSKIAIELEKENLTFVYHNHNFEFYKFGDKTVLEIIFENTPNCFFLELDTYWIQAGGANPVQWIQKTAGRCEYIHFKDMGVWDDLSSSFLPVGSGNLDWDSIIDACRESNVLYAAVEQDKCTGSPFDALKQSYDFLASKGIY